MYMKYGYKMKIMAILNGGIGLLLIFNFFLSLAYID